MDHFELVSEYKPMGDQPQAIDKIAGGFLDGKKHDAFGSNWFRQNLYHGKCHSKA